MNKIFSLLILIPFFTFGQVTIDWEQPTRGNAIAVDASNNVYTVDFEASLGSEMTITKRDADGNFIWVTSYNQTDNTKWERASWIATDHDGNVVVTGTYMSGYSNPVEAASIVMKFSSNGTFIWRQVYESSFDGSSTKKCLIDADNNIYVLGKSPAVTKVKKFDTNGNAIWSFLDAGNGAPVNFKFTPDNKIVIALRGITGSINGYEKIDLDGNKIWSLAPVFSLTVGDIAGDAFGNSYLVHTEYVTNGTTQIKKLDPLGVILWDKIFPIAGTRVEVGNDNRPIVCGYPNQNSFGTAFLKVDENGNQVWVNLDADGPQGLFLHAMMLVDNTNNAYLAAGTLFNMAVCKVNSDGSTGWTALTSNGGYANAMVFGNNINSVFVVGGITARLNDESIPTCETPVNIYFSKITATSIKVNWDFGPGAVNYELWRKKSTSSSWKIATVTGTKNSKKIQNLLCNTSYDFKIRSICDSAGTIMSEFSAVYTQSTSACRLEEEEIVQNELGVYPNPAREYLTIQLNLPEDFANGKVELADVNGKIVLREQIADAEQERLILDIRELPSGVYLLRVFDGKSVFAKQVMID